MSELRNAIEFLEQREGWSLRGLINDIIGEAELLRVEDISIMPDEVVLYWGDEEIIDLETFTSKFTIKLLDKVCNMLKSFEEGVE